jgi:hypothetical protein
MLFFGKTSNEKAFNLKALSRFLFCISAIVFGITFNSKSTQAQIENLYNEQTDQVAGITSLMSAVVGNDIDGMNINGNGKINTVHGKQLMRINQFGEISVHEVILFGISEK